MKILKKIKIGNKLIGSGEKPFIVAELSANHNGSLKRALETVLKAKQCGADAIKLQTYTPETMTLNQSKGDFMIKNGLWKGKSLYKLYEEAHTPLEWHNEIFKYSRKLKLICFSTPFDETAVDLLEKLKCPMYKIASFEICDLELIKYVAKKNKPIVLSTGMANKEEISDAIKTIKKQRNNKIILLHCVSSYPAPIDDCNLAMIQELRKEFSLNIGLSDHTIGNEVALTSISLGSVFIEKHFMLDKKTKGPDSSFSLTPNEFNDLTKKSSKVWRSIGKISYKIQKSEKTNIKFRRSLYFVKKIKLGEEITRQAVRRIRPGYGIKPKFLNKIIGRKAKKNIEPGTAVSWELIK